MTQLLNQVAPVCARREQGGEACFASLALPCVLVVADGCRWALFIAALPNHGDHLGIASTPAAPQCPPRPSKARRAPSANGRDAEHGDRGRSQQVTAELGDDWTLVHTSEGCQA